LAMNPKKKTKKKQVWCHQTKKLQCRKGNSQQNEKTTWRMGEVFVNHAFVSL
jgi:hypothetical protein